MEKFLQEKLIFLPKEIRAIAAFIIDIVVNIIVIVALVFVIRTYFISPFQVYGPSMCDTLNFMEDKCQRGFGEYIIVNKAVYQNFFGWQVGAPQRGDIVVFHPPKNEKEFFIKRIIGLPGETIKLKDGLVYIYNAENPTGIVIDEAYLNDTNKGNTQPLEELTIFKVPANEYFVLGDNRTQSSDSRSCFKEVMISKYCSQEGITPFITPSEIEGKAWIVLWPLYKMTILQNPEYRSYGAFAIK